MFVLTSADLQNISNSHIMTDYTERRQASRWPFHIWPVMWSVLTSDQFTKRNIVDKQYRTNSNKDAHGIFMHILGRKEPIFRQHIQKWYEKERRNNTKYEPSQAQWWRPLPPIWGQLIATSGTLWGMAPPQRCTAVQCTSFHQLVQNKTSCHMVIYQNISPQMISCSKFFSTLRIELIYSRSHHQTNAVCPKHLSFYWWSISK